MSVGKLKPPTNCTRIAPTNRARVNLGKLGEKHKVTFSQAKTRACTEAQETKKLNFDVKALLYKTI